MRILYLNGPIYDYMTATVIEGLLALGHDVGCTYASNYGSKIASPDVADFAVTADLVILGAPSDVNAGILSAMKHDRVVVVDGSDGPMFQVPSNIAVKAVFKRELNPGLENMEQQRVFPLLFAAERRYFVDVPRKDIRVSFMASMHTNPLRHSVYTRLVNRRDPSIVAGSTSERAYSAQAPRPNAIETPRYREMLARSQISVNVPGAGYDCARYWEIPAARALLFTYTPDIAIPHPFSDGVNCVTFDSLNEFEEKLTHYLARPDEVRTMAERGYLHLVAHHTTQHRAAYLLDKAMDAIRQPGWCPLFYKG